MIEKRDVIIIGAGASGLIAGAVSAKEQASTLILEKMPKCALKVGISGKGRANVTCDLPIQEFVTHYNAGGKFLRSAFSHFFVKDTVALFESLGVPCVTERGNRVFPKSGKAHDIRMALIRNARQNGCSIKVNEPVEKVRFSENLFRIKTQNSRYESRRLIIATGGASYPRTGSTGDGYLLAQKFGHSLIPIRPSLIYLKCEGCALDSLDNLNLINVYLSFLKGDKKVAGALGEATFSKYGLGGPIPLQYSRKVVDGETDSVEIDFKPALSHSQVDKRILRELSDPKKKMKQVLRSLLPAALIPIILEHTQSDPEKEASQITRGERKKIRLFLKGWRLSLTGVGPFEEAIVTAGGVDLRQIDKKTLESKIIKGLLFCGEILDIDGETGGFNLQAAFSTGYLAGLSASSFLGGQ